jgi:hypothetical protein
VAGGATHVEEDRLRVVLEEVEELPELGPCELGASLVRQLADTLADRLDDPPRLRRQGDEVLEPGRDAREHAGLRGVRQGGTHPADVVEEVHEVPARARELLHRLVQLEEVVGGRRQLVRVQRLERVTDAVEAERDGARGDTGDGHWVRDQTGEDGHRAAPSGTTAGASARIPCVSHAVRSLVVLISLRRAFTPAAASSIPRLKEPTSALRRTSTVRSVATSTSGI